MDQSGTITTVTTAITKSVDEDQPLGNGLRDANNSPNRDQDQGPYTLALRGELRTCVRRQIGRVLDQIRAVIWRIRRAQENPHCVPARKGPRGDEQTLGNSWCRKTTRRSFRTMRCRSARVGLSLRAMSWEERDEDLDGEA